MSDLKKMLSAANTVLKTIHDGVDAYGNFKKGKSSDAWVNIISGTNRVIKGWDNIKYSYNEIERYMDEIFGSKNRISQIYQGKNLPMNLGAYAGVWNNNDVLFILDHDTRTNLSSLTRLNDSVSYKGYYDPNTDSFLWIGYNSDNQKLVIVGTLSASYLIFADLWCPNDRGDLEYSNTVSLFKMLSK